LSAGGVLQVRPPKGGIMNPKSLTELPPGPFVVHRVSFVERELITDSDMPRFAKLTGLVQFSADRQPISDAGFKHLANQKTLESLHLWGSNVTGASLPLIGIRRRIHILACRGSVKGLN